MGNDSNAMKLIKTFGVIVFFGSIMLIVFIFSDRWVLKDTGGILRNQSQFDRYSATAVRAPDGGQYVQIRDISGMARGNIISVNSHYETDVTIETSSETLAVTMRDDKVNTVRIIRGVMAEFSKEDVETAKGREALRANLVAALSEYYQTDEIRNVYFEKLLYQSVR